MEKWSVGFSIAPLLHLSNTPTSLVQLFVPGSQKTFRLNGRGAAQSRRSNCLAVDPIRAIPCDKNSRDIRRGALTWHDVTLSIHIDKSFEHLGVRGVPNRDKNSGTLNDSFSSGFGVLNPHTRNFSM